MSCRTTSGGSASLSIARAATGLPDKDLQHLFHALKREGEGQKAPSELAIIEWRSRQSEILDTNTKIATSRAESLRRRLFRSREEPTPDGAMFYAWKNIEVRARQEAAIRAITNAVDLEPPGSQADQYELGEDGRPVNVMYASYGSNLHRDRFMTYLHGGSPEGSRRVYPGCTDPSDPEDDIPIRFHGGYRAHFALSSSVWHGGIAFMDRTEDDEQATALGRAYKLPIRTFDEVVHFENGGYTAKTAQSVPLDEVLADGRSVTGPGSYQTLLHIGDYNGMPVLTFTAPFSAHEALTETGRINRGKVSLPVRTNKPSAAYCRMIGNGLQETFGMSEVQAADYLRGMPGAERYSRREMVAILRAQAKPDETATTPGAKGTYAPTGTTPTFSAATGPAMSKDDLRAWMERTHEANGNNTRTARTASASRNAAYANALPSVRTYATVDEYEEGVKNWTTVRDQWANNVSANEARLNDPHLTDGEKAKVKERLHAARARLSEANSRLDEATAQNVTNHFSPTTTYAVRDWTRIAKRESQIADHADKRALAAVAEAAKADSAARAADVAARTPKERDAAAALADTATYLHARGTHLTAQAARAAARADEATKKRDEAKAISTNARPARSKSGRKRSQSRRSTPAHLSDIPNVRTYTSTEDQDRGVAYWREFVNRTEVAAEQVRASNTSPLSLTVAEERLALARERLAQAETQTPPATSNTSTARTPKAKPSSRGARQPAHLRPIPGNKTYRTTTEQERGVAGWQATLGRETARLDGMRERAGRLGAHSPEAIRKQEEIVNTVTARLAAAKAQTPPAPKAATTAPTPKPTAPAKPSGRAASTPAPATRSPRSSRSGRVGKTAAERTEWVPTFTSTGAQDAFVTRHEAWLASERKAVAAMGHPDQERVRIKQEMIRDLEETIAAAKAQTPPADKSA